MNKSIKCLVTCVLAINTFSIIEPIEYINLTNTVEASATVRGADLKDISLGRGSIDFKYSKTEYTLTLDSSVEELKIGAKPRESEAQVEINGVKVYESDNYKREVKLDKGENKITIEVKNGSKKKTYTLTVIRGKVEEEKQIYLNNISLNIGDIEFSKETTSYDIDIESRIREISIKAEPEDEDYYVEIDGVTVDKDDNYKRTISLNNETNEIKIKIQDDDEHEKIYALNIKRIGVSASTNMQSSSTNSSGDLTTYTTNQSQDTNKKALTIKGWYLDNGKWYYLNENGQKQVGWKAIEGKWYYLDVNGMMGTGWQSINGEWYYLDSSGAMKTGWLKNEDGKWYYLYDSGTMAKNTTIDGFRLNSSGAWIK